MDSDSAKRLNDITTRFYAENAESFSATRQDPWPGWERLIGLVGVPDSLLDLGAGNMRFERFLMQASPELTPSFFCVDSCPALAEEDVGAHFQELDFIDPLIRGRELSELIEAPACDLSVAFGVMHHVPGSQAREGLLRALVDATRDEGYISVSFWRFMDDRKLAAKARKATERALVKLDLELEDNDFLLGWQDQEGAYRYCHHFDDVEIDALLRAVEPSCDVVDRFVSDGRLDATNTYVILRKRVTDC